MANFLKFRVYGKIVEGNALVSVDTLVVFLNHMG